MEKYLHFIVETLTCIIDSYLTVLKLKSIFKRMRIVVQGRGYINYL